MSSHRSIGERLARAKSLEARFETATDWARNWQAEHDDLFYQLERAIGKGDTSTAGRLLGQLKAVDGKAFSALPSVIDKLCEGDL